MYENPVLLIVGTRPEGIKMAPVFHALKRSNIPTVLCSTMQHDHILREVFDIFSITPDIELDIMRPGQDLFYVTQSVLQKTKEVLLDVNPCLVLVQGDTTSSMAAALAAFYERIPVGHVEAGLRTDDINAPFPEEMNRRVISVISTFHFAPTPSAVANMLAHGARREQIFCTGNTVVDALCMVKDQVQEGGLTIRNDVKSIVEECRNKQRRIAVLTVHRRESLGRKIEDVLQTIKILVQRYPDVFWFYSYHPNPDVIDAIDSVGLNNLENLYLCDPLPYSHMVYILDAADVILTDSGGIQEEGVSLRTPVLVLREKTERMEGVLAGYARVVGFDTKKIIAGMDWALKKHRLSKKYLDSIYGDGHASEKIVAFIQSQYDFLQKRVRVHDATPEFLMHEKEGRVMKRVCILGLGYIGLPTGILLAEHGYDVIGVDIDKKRVCEINNGNPVIHEPEIYEKLNLVLGNANFCASTSPEEADYFLISVPTPITQDKTADLSYVFSASNSIAPYIRQGNVVILESTVPVGTTQKVAKVLEEQSGLVAGKDFFLVYCPERVLPGNIFNELIDNDRVIGGINQKSVHEAKVLYKSFVKGGLYLTSAKVAEMVKLVENASRDVELAFTHQIASLALAQGLNPYEIVELANKHPRVNMLQPTCGVGGHCIAIDPWFLIETSKEHTQLLHKARMVNDAKPFEILERIQRTVSTWKDTHDGVCTVLMCGITYKPNVDDIRESPALHIVQEWVEQEDETIDTLVVEPHVQSKKLRTLFEDRVVSMSEGLSKADIVVFLVGHNRFRIIDRKLLEGKILIDACGLLYQQHELNDDNEALIWSNVNQQTPVWFEGSISSSSYIKEAS